MSHLTVVQRPALTDALNPDHYRLHQVDRAKVLSNTIKQKRKEKAGKWEVPLPKVRGQPRKG